MAPQRGTLQITFLGLNVLFWAIGICLVGFVSWTLSTLPSNTDFMSSAFGLLYACLLLGIIIVLTGGCGCIGGMFQSICLLKTYIGFMMAFVFVEIGIAMGYYLLQDQVPDLLVTTWPQLNNDTKFTIQRQLECCGVQNYIEWSTNIDQIPASCFKVYETLSTSVKAWTLLFKTSCLDKLMSWFKDNLPVWVSVIVLICLVQHLTHADPMNYMKYTPSMYDVNTISSMFLSGLVLNNIGKKMRVLPIEDAEISRVSSVTSVHSGPSIVPGTIMEDDKKSNISNEHGNMATIEEELSECDDIVSTHDNDRLTPEGENKSVFRESIALEDNRSLKEENFEDKNGSDENEENKSAINDENIGETDSGRPRSSCVTVKTQGIIDSNEMLAKRQNESDTLGDLDKTGEDGHEVFRDVDEVSDYTT